MQQKRYQEVKHVGGGQPQFWQARIKYPVPKSSKNSEQDVFIKSNFLQDMQSLEWLIIQNGNYGDNNENLAW